MADRGEFGYDDPELDKKLDNDDAEEANKTQPFKPKNASTPYHGGEQVEIQTMQHEQSGLPDTSFDENIPLIDPYEKKELLIEAAKKDISAIYRDPDFSKLGPLTLSKENPSEVVVLDGERERRIFYKRGPRGGPKPLLKEFTERYSFALGETNTEYKTKLTASVREEEKQLKEAEKDLKRAQVDASKIKQKEQVLFSYRQKLAEIQDQKDKIKEQQGTSLEMETRKSELDHQKKNLQKVYEEDKKELAVLKKQAKNVKKAQEKVAKMEAVFTETKSKRNAVEEVINTTKTLDDL